jgi:hypothetical protein
MALDYTQYVSKLMIKTCGKMPEPPKQGDIDPDKWRAFAEDLTAYREAYVDYVKSVKAWALDQALLLEQFRADVLTVNGLTGNPKADALYEIAVKPRMSMEEVEAAVAKLAPLVVV